MTQIKQVGGTHYEDAAGKCPECLAEVQLWDLLANAPFLEANAVKYILRHRGKNGFEDLKKAVSCIEKRMAIDYPAEYAAWKEDTRARNVATALEGAGMDCTCVWCGAPPGQPCDGSQGHPTP